MRAKTIQEKLFVEREKTREVNSKMLECENCHNYSQYLLEVKYVVRNNPYYNPKIEKICFGCVMKNFIHIQWKGSFWKTIFEELRKGVRSSR